MELVRDSYLKIIPKNSFETNRIEQFLISNCTFKNPLYEKSVKYLKKPLFSKAPKYIQTFEKQKQFEKVYFNVLKANKYIFEEIQKIGLKIDEYHDNRVESEIEINNTMEPRDEQQKEAIESILNNEFNYGILSAAPSAGKSFISLYCACKFKQRTLILVDMILLIDQFVDSILKFTDVKEDEIGFIRGKEKDYKDKKIVISTIQTLTKPENQNIVDYLSENIGFVICDEVHIMSCETAQNILKYLKPKYMLGLSGTPERDDKMDFIITQAIGPIIHKSDRQEMVNAGSMITPILRPLFLKDDELFKKYNLDTEIDFRDVVDKYYNSEKAINKISNIIIHHYINNDSQLIICKENELIKKYYGTLIKKLFDKEIEEKAERERARVIRDLQEQVKLIDKATCVKVLEKEDKEKLKKGLVTEEELEEKYYDKLIKYKNEKIQALQKKMLTYEKKHWIEMSCVQKIEGIDSIRIFTGATSKKERDKIIDGINNGDIKILIVSTTFDKALSANRLNILYLLFSTRERANTIQRVG